MGVQSVLQYEQEINNNQKVIRKMVLESIEDLKAGKGRDYNEFFNELEKQYEDA